MNLVMGILVGALMGFGALQLVVGLIGEESLALSLVVLVVIVGPASIWLGAAIEALDSKQG